MEQSYGTKGLYSVVLKATYNIEDLGIEEGEVVASFDDIQIGGLDELHRVISARGGYGNPGLVTWDVTRELNLNFSQGIFSKKQLQILLNSKNGEKDNEEGIKCFNRINCNNIHIILGNHDTGYQGANWAIDETKYKDDILSDEILRNLLFRQQGNLY